MNPIKQLQQELNLSTCRFLIYDILTLGLYGLAWIYLTNSMINRFLNIQVKSPTYLLVFTIFYAWIDVLLGLPDLPYYQILIDIGYIFMLIKFIMGFIWANTARYNLIYFCLAKYHVELKTNTLWVVLFNCYYVNFLINRSAKIEMNNIQSN